MKIQIQRSMLLEALKKVQNIAPGKGSLQVLQNVKIETGDGKIVLTTSDLDLTIRADASCEVIDGGATTLPVKLLSAAISKLAEGSVLISVDGNDRASVSSGNTKFKVNGISASEFPTLPKIPSDASKYVINAKELKAMISKVQYAASQDETRRTLQGVNITFQNGNATLVATDGRRLALVDTSIEIGNTKEFSMTLPRKTVQTLMRELSVDGNVEIMMGGSQIVFAFSGMDIFSRLMDDSYPNYRQVIPANTEFKIPVDRTMMLQVLDRVSVLSESADNKSVKLNLNDGVLTVSAITADVGEAKDQIAIKYDGPATDIMFNPSYIMDALKAVDDDEVSFEINNGHSPAVIKDSHDFLYVIMPLRIS